MITMAQVTKAFVEASRRYCESQNIKHSKMKEEAPPKPENKKYLSSMEIMLQDASMHNNFTQAVMIYGMTALEFIEPLREYFSVRGIIADKQKQNQNKMKIEVGKYYRTMGGDKVRIYATDGGGVSPIHGAVYINQAWIPYTWTAEGHWYVSGGEGEEDIVSEWTEPLDFDPSCLPARAEWIAFDGHHWRWYKNKPSIYNNGWFPVDNYGYILPEYAPKNYTGDWRDSLRKVSDL